MLHDLIIVLHMAGNPIVCSSIISTGADPGFLKGGGSDKVGSCSCIYRFT